MDRCKVRPGLGRLRGPFRLFTKQRTEGAQLCSLPPSSCPSRPLQAPPGPTRPHQAQRHLWPGHSLFSACFLPRSRPRLGPRPARPRERSPAREVACHSCRPCPLHFLLGTTTLCAYCRLARSRYLLPGSPAVTALAPRGHSLVTAAAFPSAWNRPSTQRAAEGRRSE